MQKVIGVCGFKNSGKTTLVEKLVRYLTEQGFKISTIKHAHHDFDIDHEGRDSFRHRKAGASEVAVVSQNRFAIMNELRGAEPPTLDEILAKLSSCDLVIVEGYKRDSHDKIEVRNLELNHPVLAGDDPTIVAIAANGEIANSTIPVFNRDDVSVLSDFIVKHCKLLATTNSLRRAEKADAAAVRQLTREVYAKWIPVIGREPMPMTVDYEKAIQDHWIDLLEHDGKIVALVEMVPNAKHLFIVNLAVAATEQGKGLASQLLRHAEQVAWVSGLQEVQLATNQAFEDNLSFYQNRGYEAYETKPFALGGIGVRFRKSLS
jgi:molybdopterin-guanine dinucleotide biosynthesis adapter protein